jgi:hypothetical protein
LQSLSLSKGRIDSTIYHIDNDVLQALMTEYEITEMEATDIYYTSATYTKLANEATAFHKKNWMEIYDTLIKELW